MTDYEELLNHCQSEIEKFKLEKTCSKINIKNHFENLRSILEYVAQEINQKQTNPKTTVYFPYAFAKDEASFLSSVKKNIPNLAAENPDLFKLIEDIQDYKDDDKWLTDLCNLTNETKHKKLLGIDEKAKKGISIPGLINSTNSEVFIKNLVIGDVSFQNLHIKDDTISYETSDEVELIFKVIDEKIIKFADNEYDVIDFLDKCTRKITTFISNYKKI